jgi:DHA2 family multidrug resistance protein
MRNVGGSVGIAVITTLVTRVAQANQALLSPHMSKLNPIFQHRLAELIAMLTPKVGAWQATKQAARILYNTLLQQASLTSYVHNFRLVAFTCLLCAPLVLLLKKVTGITQQSAAH